MKYILNIIYTYDGDKPSDEVRQWSDPQNANKESQWVKTAPSFSSPYIGYSQNKYQITQPHDVPVDLLSQTSIRQFEQLNRYFIWQKGKMYRTVLISVNQ